VKVLHSEKEFMGRASVVALGMFDGVHIGHQKLIRTAAAIAEEMDAKCIVCTFDRHPLSVLKPEYAPQPLLPLDKNIEKFEKLGAEMVLVKAFTKELAAICAEDYIEMLVDGLKAKVIVVGENHTFGRGGRGNAEMVRQLAKKYGYRAKIVEPVRDKEGTISSTRIRTLMREGRIREAEALMDIQS